MSENYDYNNEKDTTPLYNLGPETHMYEFVDGSRPVITHSIGRVWCEETIGEDGEDDIIEFKFVSHYEDGTQYEVPCANSSGIVYDNRVWLTKRDDLLAKSKLVQHANDEVSAAMDLLVAAERRREAIKHCGIQV